jgi:hypothetical protein
MSFIISIQLSEESYQKKEGIIYVQFGKKITLYHYAKLLDLDAMFA